MKNCIASAAILVTLVPGAAKAQEAIGLTTDMLEHTEYVWIEGKPSTSLLSDIPQIIEPWQTAQICSSRPFLGWKMKSNKSNTLQTACRILIASSPLLLQEGRADVWDSGRMTTQHTNVQYGTATGGQQQAIPSLKPSTVYYWKVKLWDNHGGEGSYSTIKSFRTADKLDCDFSHYPLEKTAEAPKHISSHLYDFGTDAFSQISLTATAKGTTDTLLVHIGEQCKEGHVNRQPEGSQRYAVYTLPLLQGTHTYQVKFRKDKRNTKLKGNSSRVDPILMPSYIGEVFPMRYCELEARGEKSIAKTGEKGDIIIHDMTRHVVHYPFNELNSSFVSSDSVLNQVWNLCKHSMRALSFAGIYVDGDRERLPYEADAIINQLSHYVVDQEYSIGRRSVDHLIYHPTWPTEWILQSVIMAWNDYMYTGDKRLLEKTYKDLQFKTLSALKDENLLITTRGNKLTPEVLRSIHFKGKRISDIVDWPQKGAKGIEKESDGEADGFVFTKYNMVVNAYHYHALQLMERVASVLGFTNDAKNYQKEAKRTREAINRLFVDPRTGLYRDGIDTEHTSLHSNMFALDFLLPTQKNKESVISFIKSRRMGCSVYGAQFLLDALYDNDESDYALSLLTSTGKRSWYNMLRIGSTITTEAWDNTYKRNQDWNHAWGAAAGNIIVRKLMGIEPLEPGFSRIRIKPQTSSLKMASLTTPTLRGNVSLHIENGKMKVEIPATSTAEIWVEKPGDAKGLLVDGKKMNGKRQGKYLVINMGSGIHTISR